MTVNSTQLSKKPWTVRVHELVEVEFLFPSKGRVFATIHVASATPVRGWEKFTREPNGNWKNLEGNFSVVKLPLVVFNMTLDLEAAYAKVIAEIILD